MCPQSVSPVCQCPWGSVSQHLRVFIILTWAGRHSTWRYQHLGYPVPGYQDLGYQYLEGSSYTWVTRTPAGSRTWSVLSDLVGRFTVILGRVQDPGGQGPGGCVQVRFLQVFRVILLCSE
ncbi:hypothetical protein ACOMHN_022355 [Nucella lapillus]